MGETDGDPRWVTVRNRGGALRADVEVRQHRMVGDEQEAAGGTDAGPSPYEYLLTALGTCSAMTIRLYAARKQLPVDEVIVRVRMARSHDESLGSGASIGAGVPVIERRIELVGALTEEQRARVLQVAARCPVAQTLQKGIPVVGKADG